MSAFLRSARFELMRSISLGRLGLAAAIVMMIGILAYQDLGVLQAAHGGALLESTAWDVFYLALNNERCCTLLFPLGVLALVGDAVERDQGGRLSASVVLHGGSVGAIAVGKIAAVLVCGVAFSLLTCLSLTLFDGLAFHTSLSLGGPPAWLSYAGDTDSYLRTDPLVFALIPASWGYGAVLAGLVLAEGIVSTAIALFFMSVAPRSTLRYLPQLIALGTVLCLMALPGIWVKLNFLVRGGPAEVPGGVSDVGMVLDRFCLASYALGAGLWQTSVGGQAVLARELAINPGPYPEGYLDSSARGYAVNSFGSLALIVAVMLVFAVLRIGWAVRSSCMGRTERSIMPGAHFAGKDGVPARFVAASGIAIEGLSVRRGGHVIFENAGFHARPGEVVGLVGENGKGKTTFLLMLAGLLDPDAGCGHVLGRNLYEGPAGGCGMLFDTPAFVEERSARENVTMIARYCGISPADAPEALHSVGLNPDDRRPVRAYSLGMRKRLAFAIASMGNPSLLLLDEPLNGVDPVGVVTLRELMETHARRGGIVVVSSHMLHDLQQVCNRVYIVQDRMLAEVAYRRDVPGDLERAYLQLTC